MTSSGTHFENCHSALADGHLAVRAVLVEQAGDAIWERYYPSRDRNIRWGSGASAEELALGGWYDVPPTPDARQNVKSVTKSVMSLLVGIAHESGFIPDLDAPLASRTPSVMAPAADGRARAITTRHLLTMRSGLEWLENGEVTLRWLVDRDPLEFTLRQPFVAEPGARYRYSTADTHLLGVCLAAAVRRPLREWANEVLFQPLGFTVDTWLTEPQGRPIGGSELFLSAREMARIGRLVLDGGQAGGKQLVSRDWLALTTAAQDVEPAELRSPDPITGLPIAFPPGVRDHRDGYGYLWWLTDFRGVPATVAQGFGGQLIVVLRDLDAVVVTQRTCHPEVAPELPAQWLLDEFLVPALLAR
jgi:CubicO group peptidase (beta-lactamase class C family)